MNPQVYDGPEVLDELDTDLFPLYASPYTDGVKVMLRHGHFHFLDSQVPFRNLSVKEKFLDLVKRSRLGNYSMHCTFYSESTTNEELARLLSLPNCVMEHEAESDLAVQFYRDMLPNDLKLIVTDVVIDCFAEKMKYESRAANLWYIDQEVKLDDLKVAQPTLIVDGEHLDILIEEYRRNGVQFDGVTLAEPGSVYIQGDADTPSGVIVVKLSEETNLEVVEFKDDTMYVEKDASLKGFFTVYSNSGTVYHLNLTCLSQKAKEQVWALNRDTVGKTLAVKQLRLRSQSLPVCETIREIRYAEITH